ncbi:hypothetical protein BC938DRAFT_474293, partial [Jimgerdemannia flammicorona]
KFTLYDLVTHNSTHYELQVTQKLFGLCTFNTYTPPAYPGFANYPGSSASSVTGAAASPISGTASSVPSVPSVLSRRESLRDDEVIFGASGSDAEIGELALLEREEEDDWEDEAGGYDMFVACAWNGMTYLIDWSVAAEEMATGEGGGEEVVGGKMREEEQAGRESEGESEDEWEDVEVERIVEAARKADADGGGEEKWRDGEGGQGVEREKKRFHVAKFAFEERVCAFAAGLYAVDQGQNVPCLFYVDFDDQIWVYHDVRISPSPVVGFLDVMGADVGEALERVITLEKTVGRNTEEKSSASLEELQKAELDLGDEWRGIVEKDFDFDVGRKKVEGTTGVESEAEIEITGSVAVELELPDLVHRCLYDFAGLKEELEADIEMLENVISPLPEPVSPTSPLTPTQTLLFGSINTILAAKPARPDRNDDHSDTESLPTPTQSTIAAGLRSRESPYNEVAFESPEHMSETELEQVQQAEGPVNDGEGIEHKEDTAGSLVQEDEDKMMPLVMPLPMVSEASASLVSMEGRPVREEEVMDDESVTLPLSTGLVSEGAISPALISPALISPGLISPELTSPVQTSPLVHEILLGIIESGDEARDVGEGEKVEVIETVEVEETVAAEI